jgi:hypothetical protein
MLVNHEAGRGTACSACAKPLGSSYVRHVRTQQRYCNYDCYRRQLTITETTWPYRSSLETTIVLAAISSWTCMMQMGALSRSLTESFLRAHDLLTTEGGDH